MSARKRLLDGHRRWGTPSARPRSATRRDARRIRQFAKRRQKNDRRDAELLLGLLRSGDFPTVHRPSAASREALLPLRGRERLVRHMLVEAAMSAVRVEEELGRFYRRLRGKRKAHGVALVAVARRLVLRLYRMLREKKDYQEFRSQGRDADVPDSP